MRGWWGQMVALLAACLFAATSLFFASGPAASMEGWDAPVAWSGHCRADAGASANDQDERRPSCCFACSAGAGRVDPFLFTALWFSVAAFEPAAHGPAFYAYADQAGWRPLDWRGPRSSRAPPSLLRA